MTLRSHVVRVLVAGAALSLSVLVTACGGQLIFPPGVEQRTDPDPELVAEAIRFCELVPPPDAVVTAVVAYTWQDDSVYMTAVMSPKSVDILLQDSRFTEPLDPGGAVHWTSLPDGSEIPTGPAVASAKEQQQNGFVREVLIDRSDPGRSRVHFACW